MIAGYLYPLRLAPPSELGVLYRYEIVRHSNGVDEFDNPYPGHTVQLTKLTFNILKRTPNGAWIGDPCSRKFVRTDAKKRYACPTEMEALVSFIARKKVQICIIEGQAADAREAIKLATKKIEAIAEPAPACAEASL